MKILQIAYHYPPMGGAGVQRALKFSRYLGAHGVTPVVLAAADAHYVQDASLAAELPAGLEVHRVPHTPWLATLAARRRAALGRGGAAPAAGTPSRGAMTSPGPTASPRASPGPMLPAAATTQGAPSGAAPRIAAATAPALRDWALSAWRALRGPDEMAAWARRAAPLARGLIDASRRSGAEPIRLVFSSAPPVSAHRLGARVAQAAGLPWVADWRDLWTDNPAAADVPRWRAALDRRLEADLLAGAAGIVTVTQTWAELLARRAGGGVPVAFVPNGYDESDFAAPLPAPRGDGAFRLTHVGTFYGPRDPGALLAGAARLLAADPAAARRLRLRLVGNLGARFEPLLARFEQAHPGVVERVAYLPHAEAIAEMRAADALLLVVGGRSGDAAAAGWLPGKLFEYLRAQRPLLALGAPAGEAAAIVRDCGAGQTVDPADPAALAAALAALLAGRYALPPARQPIAAYERRALAGELAAFLKRVAG